MLRAERLSRTAGMVFAASLSLCALLYIPFTVHWPLVGDASLIHYIAFLTERGWAPYRQLGDMNMPGSFLIELAAMHVYGRGALAWRLFDLTLVSAAAVAFGSILGRRRWLPALFAASLFTLIHGRDGLAQGGQRDLTMAVCLLGATACVLAAVRRSSIAAAVGFGLLSGFAVSIKPTALLLTVVQCVVVARALRRSSHWNGTYPTWLFISAAAGWLLGPAACIVFLLREHAVGAFLAGLTGIVPYYSSLGHRPLPYVLGHSLSPIEPLAALWVVVLILQRIRLRHYFGLRRQLLAAGVLFGFANCIAQHRALPYYRYPLLAFLLPLLALDLTSAAFDAPQDGARGAFAAGRVLAFAGLTFAALFLAPQSAALIHRYRWNDTAMLDSLQHALEQLGGPELSGHVQCIDSVSGCGTVLYRMRLEPATGVLSDFLLFGNTTDTHPPEDIPVIRETRAEFLSAIEADPPAVMVVTSHLHMTGPEDFGKLDRWPAFQKLLASRYRIASEWHPARPERWWSRQEYPAAYRIYTLTR